MLDADRDDAQKRRRLKGFGLHMLGYFVTMAVAIPVNLFMTPDRIWFLFPLVAWGAPLALHAAWAMGIFDGLFRVESKSDQSKNGP